MPRDAVDTVKLFWEEIWSAGDTELVAEVLHADARENGEPLDAHAFASAVAAWRRIFPDFTATIEELIPIGEGRVASRVTYRGTQRSPWIGLPATGRSFEAVGVDLFTVRDGRIAELWHAADHLELVVQLGGRVVPKAEDV